MPKSSKICPLTKELCDPLSQKPEETANQNCTFFVSDPFSSRCLYLDAMKAMPLIAENIRKIKIQNG